MTDLDKTAAQLATQPASKPKAQRAVQGLSLIHI